MRAFTSFDGLRIAYHDEGEGPVVILHGFGVDGLGQFGDFERILPLLEKRQEMFCEVFGGAPPLLNPPPEGRPGVVRVLLTAGARVILPDMRGFGASDKPRDQAAYGDSAMARDVVALIEHLRLVAVEVIGFSMGAGTAAQLLISATASGEVCNPRWDRGLRHRRHNSGASARLAGSRFGASPADTSGVGGGGSADSGEGRNRARAPWLRSSYCSSCHGSRPESLGGRHSGCGRTCAACRTAPVDRSASAGARQMQPTRRWAGSSKRFHCQVRLNAKGTITPLRMNRHFSER